MVLPEKNISLLQVACILGKKVSNGLDVRLFELVCSSMIGGEGGYAFRIAENGYTDGTRGFLIDGALPYWNIWSPKGPGVFFLDIDRRIKLRLKYDTSYYFNPYYMASLGSFSGYDTEADAPAINCTNAVNGVIDYYPSFNLRLVFFAVCSGINWKSIHNSIEHFYIKVTGIFASGGGEDEIAVIESPEYVSVDGSTRTYNQQHEMKNFGSVYRALRFDFYVGYMDVIGERVLFKIPYIEPQTVRLSQIAEGLTLGNFLWFYIYNPYSGSLGFDNVIIPGGKIQVSSQEIEFQPNSGTPYDGRYVLKFNAKIVGDYYVTIPGYGTIDIQGSYDVLAKGYINKKSGEGVDVDYESLGKIYMDTNSSYNNFELPIPTEWASNKFDSGSLHLFIRMKSQP